MIHSHDSLLTADTRRGAVLVSRGLLAVMIHWAGLARTTSGPAQSESSTPSVERTLCWLGEIVVVWEVWKRDLESVAGESAQGWVLLRR